MTDRGPSVLDSLTGRQTECILRVKEGMNAKQIARELGIAPKTVELHISAAMKRLGVSSRLAIVSLLYDEDVRTQTEVFVPRPNPSANDEYISGEEPHQQADSSATAGLSPRLLPPLGGSLNRASQTERIVWVGRIALVCIMLACAFILSVVGVIAIAARLAS